MANRELDAQEREALERMIDNTDIIAVMTALSEICGEKADHIEANWQDKPLARAWRNACGAIGCTAASPYLLPLHARS